LKLSDFIDNESVLVPKVTQIKSLRIYKEYQLMEVLANCCSNTLKTLTISHIDSDENEKILSFSMKQISRLVNLEELSLDLWGRLNISKDFIEDMKNIGINCAKIKSLGIKIKDINPFTVSDLLNSLQYFSQIKIMNFDIFSGHLTHEQNTSIKSLEKCKQLTHFHLHNKFCTQNSDEFFKDIHLFLPQLTHFSVSTDGKMSKSSFNSLTKLNKLKEIHLYIDVTRKRFEFFADKMISDIINNCTQIKNIKLLNAIITHKTIDALIGLALKKPQIQFNHQFGVITKKKNHKKSLIYKNESDLPNNLNITIDFTSNKWKKFYF
jgi:hypothetical protein